MNNIFRQRSLAFFPGLLLLLIVLLFLLRLPFLVAADRDNNPVLFFPLAGEKNFSIYYIHSVQKTPVWENFTVEKNDNLLLASTEYQSLGVGTPFLPSEGKLIERQGRFILTGLNRSFKEIDIGASPIPGHILIYKNKKYKLNDYFAPDALVRIRVDRRSAAQMIWQSMVH